MMEYVSLFLIVELLEPIPMKKDFGLSLYLGNFKDLFKSKEDVDYENLRPLPLVFFVFPG